MLGKAFSIPRSDKYSFKYSFYSFRVLFFLFPFNTPPGIQLCLSWLPWLSFCLWRSSTCCVSFCLSLSAWKRLTSQFALPVSPWCLCVYGEGEWAVEELFYQNSVRYWEHTTGLLGDCGIGHRTRENEWKDFGEAFGGHWCKEWAWWSNQNTRPAAAWWTKDKDKWIGLWRLLRGISGTLWRREKILPTTWQLTGL